MNSLPPPPPQKKNLDKAHVHTSIDTLPQCMKAFSATYTISKMLTHVPCNHFLSRLVSSGGYESHFTTLLQGSNFALGRRAKECYLWWSTLILYFRERITNLISFFISFLISSSLSSFEQWTSKDLKESINVIASLGLHFL